MPKIDQGTVDRLPVPLPPRGEQLAIVSAVERCLSVVDSIESDAAVSTTRADRLRQSILKRAFEGHLIPQNPNDEPATELLARIKAERDTSAGGNGKPKRSRRRVKG